MIVIGLDIGTTKVVAIAGRKNEQGKLEILGFGRAASEGVNHGIVMNINQCITSIEAAIKNCLKSNPNLEINEVYVGISGQHIKSLQTRGERIRANPGDVISDYDVDVLVKDQYKTYIPPGDQIIDIVPSMFTVDNATNVHDPRGMNGASLGATFHIITGNSSAIKNIKLCVDKASISIRDLVLQPLASAAAVISDEDLELGVAVVDIGGGTTDMAIFHDGMLQHIAVIPYAGVNITNDIRSGLGVLRAQAEQMKVQFGTALASEMNDNTYITIPGLRGLLAREISAKNLAYIIQARTQEILDYVYLHIKQVGLDKKLNGGIILTGGGAQLKNVSKLAEYTTGLEARIGLPNVHLVGEYSKALLNPVYSTCIGLILRGYHDIESNKLPLFDNEGKHTKIENSNISAIVDEYSSTENNDSRRADKMRKLFDGLKEKFMYLFEHKIE